MKTLSLVALACIALSAAGCTAFRSDVSAVTVYGGYRSDSGDAYKGGVSFDIRPPASPTPAPDKSK